MQIELSEAKRRLFEKLYNDLGKEIINLLNQKDVTDIMVNPDGTLWTDSQRDGQLQVGTLTRSQAFSIIYDIAGIHDFIVTQKEPKVEAELPCFREMNGERFAGQIPPIVSGPSFSIRKKSNNVFSLDDYVDTNRLTIEQAEILRRLVVARKNILVCGGPGSGKTTVTNALIIEAVKNDKNQRFVILEDIPELQCAAPNRVSMLTSDTVNMTGLLRAAMRMRPDRILIGEVMGKEALDMLKAWNTGCPGGICTVHANGAEEAIQRITDLAMEAGLSVPPNQLVGHTINAIVSVIRKGSQKGFISEILTLGECINEKFKFEKIG